MRSIARYFGPMRVPFLLLPPVCVFLGCATAIWRAGHISYSYLIIALIGALTAHISVNAFNEYFDFKSGLDSHTTRTPFSGGSGTLPENPSLAFYTLSLAIITLIITMIVGVFFSFKTGIGIIPIGITGILTIVLYSVWLVKNPVYCLIAPGLGFGSLMVIGTDYVLTGTWSPTVIFASMVPFFLVSNLLLLNQFPDIEADRSNGRRHLPIVIGNRKSSLVYGAFLLLTYICIVAGVILHYLPLPALIGLFTIVFAVPSAIGAFRYSNDIPKLLPSMGKNVLINLLTPLLVGIGLLLSRYWGTEM